MKHTIYSLLGLLFCSVACADIQLASIFDDGMVLQRGQPMPVWGKAAPGESITIGFAGQTVATRADQQGLFKAALKPLRASRAPQNLTVSGTDSEVTCEDVLVGDVWVFIEGWWNFGLGSEDCPAPYADARICAIGFQDARQFPTHARTARAAFGKADPAARWTTGEAGSRRRGWPHSLITARFANYLVDRFDIPVGILRVYPADLEAMTPPQGFGRVAGLEDIAARVASWDPASASGRKAYADWLAASKAWARDVQRSLDDRRRPDRVQPPEAPGPAFGKADEPTVHFNQNIHPIVPFPMTGVVCQNMDSHHFDIRACEKLQAFVRGMRDAFGNPTLPFCLFEGAGPNIFYFELWGEECTPNIHGGWGGENGRTRYILFREHQARACAALPGVTFIPTKDLGTGSDYARRLLNWATATVYKTGPRTPTGPIYASHEVKGNRIHIAFSNVRDRLMTGSKWMGKPAEESEGEVRFVQIAGSDRVWRRASTAIQGQTLVAWHDKIDQPIAVRYAFQSEVHGPNLYSDEGLPAALFRTDDWAIPSFTNIYPDYQDMTVAELVTRLGYPYDVGSLAAAQALGARGEGVLPRLKTLLRDPDSDVRGGAARAIGFLYGAPRVASKYRDVPLPESTPATEAALELVARAYADKDYMVRGCAADAMLAMGQGTPRACELLLEMAGDPDPVVRAKAMRVARLRIHDTSPDTSLLTAMNCINAYGTQQRDATERALSLMSRYARQSDKMDYQAFARFVSGLQPGQILSRFVGQITNTRITHVGDYRETADVMDAYLHLTKLGVRCLEALYRPGSLTPAVRKTFEARIPQWREELARIEADQAFGWQGEKARMQQAIEVVERALAPPAK